MRLKISSILMLVCMCAGGFFANQRSSPVAKGPPPPAPEAPATVGSRFVDPRYQVRLTPPAFPARKKGEAQRFDFNATPAVGLGARITITILDPQSREEFLKEAEGLPGLSQEKRDDVGPHPSALIRVVDKKQTTLMLAIFFRDWHLRIACAASTAEFAEQEKELRRCLDSIVLLPANLDRFKDRPHYVDTAHQFALALPDFPKVQKEGRADVATFFAPLPENDNAALGTFVNFHVSPGKATADDAEADFKSWIGGPRAQQFSRSLLRDQSGHKSLTMSARGVKDDESERLEFRQRACLTKFGIVGLTLFEPVQGKNAMKHEDAAFKCFDSLEVGDLPAWQPPTQTPKQPDNTPGVEAKPAAPAPWPADGKIESEDGRFRVSFPKAPKKSIIKGLRDSIFWDATHDDGSTFRINYTTIIRLPNENIEQARQRYLDASLIVLAKDAKDPDSKSIHWRGMAARELTFTKETPNGNFACKFQVGGRDDKFYIQRVELPLMNGKTRGKENADRFFQSFEFLDQAPKTDKAPPEEKKPVPAPPPAGQIESAGNFRVTFPKKPQDSVVNKDIGPFIYSLDLEGNKFHFEHALVVPAPGESADERRQLYEDARSRLIRRFSNKVKETDIQWHGMDAKEITFQRFPDIYCKLRIGGSGRQTYAQFVELRIVRGKIQGLEEAEEFFKSFERLRK